MKKTKLSILALLLAAAMLLCACGGDGEGKSTDGSQSQNGTGDQSGVNETDGGNDGADGTEPSDTAADTEPAVAAAPYDFSALVAVGSTGGVYAEYSDGSQMMAESDLFMTFDTSKADADYVLKAAYKDKDGGEHAADVWSSKNGISDSAKDLGLSVVNDGEYSNAVRLWIYFLEVPDNFGSTLTFYGSENGTETGNFVTYELLDVGTPSGGNISGVYFNTSSDSDNVTVGDTITVTFDMTLSQMYGLKASYDVDGTANYCNIACFGEDYAETPFDGTADYQYFQNYGVFDEDAARLGMSCELHEGETFTTVTFTVNEILVSSFSFYGCIDANETYGWHTYTMS